jgi:eukaryotic-like serine/threonine-protein kinase
LPELADPIGRSIGNYVITEPLGSGGMGSLFVAEHPAIGRRVAVKFLAPHLTRQPEMAERFLREAQAVACIDHPNVVEIFDFGEFEEQPYYMMELLDGCELGQVLERGRLSVEEASPYVTQICAALQASHAKGIVHRDLKPGNIFVLKRLEQLTIKLLDFGLAKLASGELEEETTQTGQVLGTPHYMAPEQAAGATDQIGAHTDIYSLGVILFRMLAGQPVFQAASPVLLMMMHIRDAPPSLHEVAPELPAGITNLVERCLRKNPWERPATAGEVAAAFEGALRGDPPAAAVFAPGPPSAPAEITSEARVTSAEKTQAVALSDVELDVPAGFDAEAKDAEPSMTPDDQAALHLLLQRMHKKGDFPAITKSIMEISRKALVHGNASASQLSESIRKDHALSTKLLQLVNSAYYERVAVPINTVSRAVVVLGFDQVRMAALSLTLFSKLEQRERAAELYDAAVGALMSGEIAKRLADLAGFDAGEEVFLCAMFRSVGRHLVLYYLPEPWGQIQDLVQQEQMEEEVASRRVLGLPFEKIGIGITRHWGLSERLVESLRAIPAGQVQRPRNDAERLRVVASYAHDLCQLISTVPPALQPRRLAQLASRYEPSLPLKTEQLPELLHEASETIIKQYAGLFDLDLESAGLLKRVASIVGLPRGARAKPKPASKPAVPRAGVTELARRARRTAAATGIEAVTQALDRGDPVDDVLNLILETLHAALGLEQCLLFILDPDRRQMQPRAGRGGRSADLVRGEAMPVEEQGEDLFSQVIFHGKDLVVEDAAEQRYTRRLPGWFQERIADRGLALFSLQVRNRPVGLIYVGAQGAGALLTKEELAAADKLRNLAIRALTTLS